MKGRKATQEDSHAILDQAPLRLVRHVTVRLDRRQ